jgi:hypothetical protein
MNALGRRQRQARNKYSHLAPRQRPNYKMRDLSSSVAHESRLREKAKAMQARKGAKK